MSMHDEKTMNDCTTQGIDDLGISSTNDADMILNRDLQDACNVVDSTCKPMEQGFCEGENGSSDPPDLVEFKVIWNKKTFPIIFDLEKKVEELKAHIKELTGIPVNMQKLMYKGLIKDHSITLREAKISKGVKLMVVGSTLKDVLTVTPPSQDKTKESKSTENESACKESLCSQKMHKKILEKGKPEDIMPGIKGIKERLPAYPLAGMYNKRAGKVRLTFKLELDQVWLGTKDRTEKLPMTSIRNVISEPIEGHEEYHILALQLGPTEASRYWIYWVPAQYVDAIKDAVLGRWQSF